MFGLRLELTDKKDIKLVDQIKKERSRMKLTQPIGCRPAVESDIEDIMLIVRQARNYLKKHRVDQWQGEYPTQDIFAADIANGECYAVTYGERLAGFFCLTEAPTDLVMIRFFIWMSSDVLPQPFLQNRKMQSATEEKLCVR